MANSGKATYGKVVHYGHRNWYQSKAQTLLPISLPL